MGTCKQEPQLGQGQIGAVTVEVLVLMTKEVDGFADACEVALD